jgi:hypothetical protein
VPSAFITQMSGLPTRGTRGPTKAVRLPLGDQAGSVPRARRRWCDPSAFIVQISNGPGWSWSRQSRRTKASSRPFADQAGWLSLEVRVRVSRFRLLPFGLTM